MRYSLFSLFHAPTGLTSSRIHSSSSANLTGYPQMKPVLSCRTEFLFSTTHLPLIKPPLLLPTILDGLQGSLALVYGYLSLSIDF